MLDGLFVIIFCGRFFSKWISETDAAKKRKQETKSKYYCDKYGDKRVVATGKHVTSEDIATDLKEFDEGCMRRKYNVYLKNTETQNHFAENRRKQVFGALNPSDVLLFAPLPYEEWLKSTVKKLFEHSDEQIIKDNYYDRHIYI